MSVPTVSGSAMVFELIAPFELAHLVAIGFAVFDHLKLPDTAVRVDPHRVSDQLVLADHLIHNEPAYQLARGARLPDVLLGHPDLHA
jgi:hypothetical protein